MHLDDNITPHFKWGEAFVTNQAGGQAGLVADFKALSPTLQALYSNNLRRLFTRLEDVRKHLGNRPITITSGFRSKRVNDLVGGAKQSYHTTGMAVDIAVKGMTPQQVQDALEHTWQGGLGYGKTFTHLDIRPCKISFPY